MFRKFINSLKNLSQEELFTLGSSIGIVFLGFLIYVTWQYRLPNNQEPEQNEEQIVEENSNKEDEEETEPVNNDLETSYDYIIKDLKKEIKEKEERTIFGIGEPSDFSIDYKGVSHSVFKNEEDLSIEEWVKRKIEEKGPTEETFEEQKEFLDILIIREKDTKLGSAREVVRVNGNQAEELYISWNDYVLGFYYQSETSDGLSAKKEARSKLIEKIEEK